MPVLRGFDVERPELGSILDNECLPSKKTRLILADDSFDGSHPYSRYSVTHLLGVENLFRIEVALKK